MRALCAALAFLFAYCVFSAVHAHVRTLPAVTTTEQP